MKRSILKRKKLFVAIAVVGLIAVGASVGAYAYFSQGGSGTGSATVGTSSAIELSSTEVGALYPGGADLPVDVAIHNPGSSDQYVGTVSGTVATSGACLGSWFSVDSVDFAQTIGKGQTATASSKIRMAETNTNQDACQGKTLTINWTSI